MKRSNVRPSVCPIDRPQQQSAAGSLLSARGRDIIDCCTARLHQARRAGVGAQQQRRRSTELSSKRGQLNTDS